MKIVFMGTPDFAVPCLEALIENGHQVSLVVTQADKPKGRGHKLTPPPVKECAIEHNIPVFQPTTMKDDESYRVLKEQDADLFIVVAYGKILPERILNLPAHGCINVHASLLPKYRGAAPIQWSIISGNAKTGVTTMQMDAGLDTGDMLLAKETDILPTDTGETLHDKLSLLGKDVLIETIQKLEQGSLERTKQDDSLSCYAPMIDKSTAKIDFSRSADEICRLIRAMNSYPLAHTTYEEKLMKIVEAEKAEGFTGNTGEIISANGNGIVVKCGTDAICIRSLQMEGKRKMPVSEFLKGNSINTGTILK